MDVQRTICSFLGNTIEEPARVKVSDTEEKDGIATQCEKLMGVMLSGLCYWYHFSCSGSKKRINIDTDPAHGLAEAFMVMLFDGSWAAEEEKMRKLKVRTIDAAFTLY